MAFDGGKSEGGTLEKGAVAVVGELRHTPTWGLKIGNPKLLGFIAIKNIPWGVNHRTMKCNYVLPVNGHFRGGMVLNHA